jgi:hypothetical protein
MSMIVAANASLIKTLRVRTTGEFAGEAMRVETIS